MRGSWPREDKAINPDIERNMYRRAGAKMTEIKGSHVIFISQPAGVANVIIGGCKRPKYEAWRILKYAMMKV